MEHRQEVMSEEQNRLWNEYLRKSIVPFDRRCVMGDYVVDFYCPRARLAVEIGGGAEGDDRRRREFLRSLGVEELCFSPQDVASMFDGVCDTITGSVHRRMEN